MISTLPLRTDYRDRTIPSVTLALIVVNTIVFLYEVLLGDRLDGFIATYATVPCEVLATCPLPAGVTPSAPYWSLFTSMFLHGGWMHLIGNMLYLWVFGQNVEDAFGHVYYLVFYLVCGVAANLAEIAMAPASSTPGLGASGAIAGLLGAYVFLFPLANVRTLVRVGFLFFLPRIPAVVLLGLWFLLQFFSELGSLGASTETGGVAYSAHVGGFLVGLAWAWLWRTRHVATALAEQS
ncbi:MAG TPA: rhomboid family intramembrane serine protease [Chloroflexota bacterium]|jgi:membrane associated rhomboid family serine protease